MVQAIYALVGSISRNQRQQQTHLPSQLCSTGWEWAGVRVSLSTGCFLLVTIYKNGV